MVALAGHAIVAWAVQVVHEHADGDGWASPSWLDDPDALIVEATALIEVTETVAADARRWLHLAACTAVVDGVPCDGCRP